MVATMKPTILVITLITLLTSCSVQHDPLIIYDAWQEQQATFIEFNEKAPYANEYIVWRDGEAIQNGTAIFSPLILWFLPEGDLEISMRRLGVGEWQEMKVSVDANRL